MELTPEQLEVIRESTTDEQAFQRVMSIFEATPQPLSEPIATSTSLFFNLDSVQRKLISAIMSTIQSVIFMKDLDSRFIMANQACLEMNHYTLEEELLGKTDFDLMSADKAQVHFDMEQKLFHMGIPIVDVENHFIDSANTPKWYLETKSPIYNQDGKVLGLVGILRDITPQKLAEQSLEKERNLLQTIIDHIVDEIYIKDRDSCFIVANAATIQAHQTTAEGIVGTTDFDYQQLEQAQTFFDEEQKIMETGIPISGQIVSAPSKFIDGVDDWYLSSKMPVYDEHGVITGLVGVNRNITPQKLAEHSLENERNLLQTIINHIADKIYIKDRESRFIIANTATLQAHQTTSERIVGTTDFDYMRPEHAQMFFDEEQKIIETGTPIFEQEISILSNFIEGDEEWYLISKVPVYDEHGVITGLVGVNRNITRQKLAEQSLESERNLLQMLLDNVQAKIYIKDHESRFIGANASTLKMYSRSLEELLGSTDFDYMPAKYAQELFDEEQMIMATGHPVINKELYTPAEVTQGNPKWFLVNKVPTYDENGKVSGLVGVNHDITDIKLAERKATELQLEQGRSKILADFITKSSHEFRTPISVINTSAYLLEKVDDPEKRKKYATRISEQTTRLLNLLDSLLLMSRIDRITQLETETLNLQSFLQDMADQFQSKLLDKGQTMQLIVDNLNIRILGNQEMLLTAISAILDNALRYTPDQGEIILSGDIQDDNAIISIQDTGMGMTDETKNRIFERFFREDEAHSTSGFGLGLPIALRVIELHSGHIEVESQINVGSQFTIILPQAPQTHK